jgi:hypothetical protein
MCCLAIIRDYYVCHYYCRGLPSLFKLRLHMSVYRDVDKSLASPTRKETSYSDRRF